MAVNLGTMIELQDFLKEWRTVLVCLGSLVILGLILIPLGTVLFGQEYALAAYPPITGGSTAAMLVADAANAVNKPHLVSLAWLLCTFQMLVGAPVSAFFLQRYCRSYVKSAAFLSEKNLHKEKPDVDRTQKRRIIPAIPQAYNTYSVVIAKLLIVALAGSYLSQWTGLPVVVVCLIFSILMTERGFLDRKALQSRGLMNMLVFILMVTVPLGFTSVTADMLLDLLKQGAAFLLLDCTALCIGGLIMGKILRVPVMLSIAISLTVMFGFPYTMLIPEGVIKTLNLPEKEAGELSEVIVPKMVIAGFTSVTIASVLIAGFFTPLIT